MKKDKPKLGDQIEIDYRNSKVDYFTERWTTIWKNYKRIPQEVDEVHDLIIATNNHVRNGKWPELKEIKVAKNVTLIFNTDDKNPTAMGIKVE